MPVSVLLHCFYSIRGSILATSDRFRPIERKPKALLTAPFRNREGAPHSLRNTGFEFSSNLVLPHKSAATAHRGPPFRSSLASLKWGPHRPHFHFRVRLVQGTMRGGACVGALICLSVACLPSASADARPGLVGRGSGSWRMSVSEVVQGAGSVLAFG